MLGHGHGWGPDDYEASSGEEDMEAEVDLDAAFVLGGGHAEYDESLGGIESGDDEDVAPAPPPPPSLEDMLLQLA